MYFSYHKIMKTMLFYVIHLNIMIDRIDEQPTTNEGLFRRKGIYFDRRGGKDRRKGSTVIDPAKDRRKGERRNKYEKD